MALEGCDTQGTHNARHTDEDSTLWALCGDTEARCQLYNFPVVNQNQNTLKYDQESLFTVKFWRSKKKKKKQEFLQVWPIAL